MEFCNEGGKVSIPRVSERLKECEDAVLSRIEKLEDQDTLAEKFSEMQKNFALNVARINHVMGVEWEESVSEEN